MGQTIGTSSHVLLDRRSLEMHRLIVEKIRRDSGLFLKAIDNVERWKNASRTVPDYLIEWENILRTGLDPALSILLEDSERAAALRQSTPFAGILTPTERWEFLRKWKENNSNI
jgi:hypothetical protein